MIEIYRVEHRDTKLGPFQTPDIYTQQLAKTAGRIAMLKAPDIDGLYQVSRTPTKVFGCANMETLKRWVFLASSFDENKKIIENLSNLGFVLAEYIVEASDYKRSHSGIQVLFDNKTALENCMVQYHSLHTLLEAAPLLFSYQPWLYFDAKPEWFKESYLPRKCNV